MRWGLSGVFFAMAALALAAVPAYAAGPFDGKWTLTAQHAGTGPAEAGGPAGPAGCQGFIIHFTVLDNNVNTKLKRASYGNYVENSEKGTPFTGTIAPDGTFVGKWQKYKITGKFSGNNVQMNWKGGCGPRTAAGTRTG
jgi:hypothetical protein